MDDELTLDRPFMLGLQTAYFLPPPPFTHGLVTQITEQLVNLTERCGVSTGVYGHLQAKIASWARPAPDVTPADLRDVQGNIKGIQGHLVSELQKIRVLRLKSEHVSGHLKSLPTELRLSLVQMTLCQETIRCLECGAYRSAIVMGWNTIYDYLRTWIVTDSARLADFNKWLAKFVDNKKRKPKYAPVSSYSDLQALKVQERTFLQSLRSIKGLDQDCIPDLVRCLNRRNKNAHATKIINSNHVANSFIEELIEIAMQHFKHDAKAAAI